MDFDLSPEQQLLRDNVARLLKERYSFEARKAYQATVHGWSEEMWRAYAEMGLPGASFAEEDGGFGGGAIETMLIMEEFGRALALEPYFDTVVLAGGAIGHAGTPAQRAAHLAAIASGDVTMSLAFAERQSGYDLFDVGASARKDGAGAILNGEKVLVGGGDSAKTLIISARAAGGRRDTHGIGLYLVDAGAPGVGRRGYATQDGRRAADITLTNVHVEAENVLGDPENGLSVLERVADEAVAALSAEAVGAMSEALTTTVEYLKTRKQFGVAIGSFQALQHRAADMVVALEQARSMMMLATMMAGETNRGERAKAMSAAKIQIGRSGRFIGQQAVQLHGGVAMTYELKLGHLFKRLTMIEASFGDADFHLRRLSEAGSLFR